MTNKLIDFYKGIVESLGMTVNDKGGVYLFSLNEDEPFNVDGKHLVLPLDSILKNPNWEKQIAFHPLSENIARKDSVVFKSLQAMANISIDTDIGYIMGELITYCADSERHGKLNAKQTSFLSLFPNADETSLKNWLKIEAKIGNDHHYARLVTYRDKKLNGESWSRVTFVTFPLYNELCKLIETKNGDYTVYGVKLRKKDVEGIKALFEYILRNVADPDAEYSTGTRSLLAPSFHSFISSYYKVKKDLERTFKLLKLDTSELGWGVYISDLNQFKGLIPSLQGNEGEVTEGERRRQELNVTQPAQPAQVKQIVPAAPPLVPQVQPVQPQQPVQSQPLYQNTLQQATQPAAQPTNPVNQTSQPATTRVSGGLVKREIPVGQAQGLMPINPQMQQPMMPQMQMNQQGQYVDAFGRPLPMPNYSRAQVIGYSNQPMQMQPQMQQPMQYAQQPYMQPAPYMQQPMPYTPQPQMGYMQPQMVMHPLMR